MVYRKLSLVLTVFIGLFTVSSNCSAQEVKPEDCKTSDAAILKKCFASFTAQMKDMKTKAEDKAKVLKGRPGLDLSGLKSDYEATRKQIESTLNLMKKRSNPDFTTIKQQLDNAVIGYKAFIVRADSALDPNSNAAPSFGILGFIIDFGCQILNLPPSVCDLIRDLAHSINVKQLAWKKWDSIKIS